MTKTSLAKIDDQIIETINSLIAIRKAANNFCKSKVSESLGKIAGSENESENLAYAVEVTNSHFGNLSIMLADIVAELEGEDEELTIASEITENGIEYKGRYNDNEEND